MSKKVYEAECCRTGIKMLYTSRKKACLSLTPMTNDKPKIYHQSSVSFVYDTDKPEGSQLIGMVFTKLVH